MSLVKEKKNCRSLKLYDERLVLRCEWNLCSYCCYSWETFDSHLMQHIEINALSSTCHWTTCDYDAASLPSLVHHVSYHGYISKLINIGQNVVERLSLSECNEKKVFNIPNDKLGYTCEWGDCSENLNTIYDFLAHLKHHISRKAPVSTEPKSKVISCLWTGCDASFRKKSNLSDHLRTHSKEKQIGCPTCFAVFSTKAKFRDHRMRQKSVSSESFKCPECLKLFPSSGLLKDHVRCHTYTNKCSLCDMTCAKPSILVKHLRSKHVSYKPHECSKCEKKFVTKQNLDTHVKVHEKENPIKCDLCDFSCRTKVGMSSHLVAKHEGASLCYECHYCKVTFTRGRYLSKHLLKKHNCQLPSGFSKFRYRKEGDGVYRLQTGRVGSMGVMGSESMPTAEAEENVDGLFDYETNEDVLTTESDESPKLTDEDILVNNVLLEYNEFDEIGTKWTFIL